MSALRNDLVGYARLVEVFMMAEPHDYSPDKVRKYLKRYDEIAAKCDELKAQRFDPDRPPTRTKPEQWRFVRIKRDIDMAIGWLQSMDQRAALFVFEHYIDYEANTVLRETDRIANRHDCSQRTVHRNISAAIQEMAEYLGYRPASDEAQQAA